MRKLWTSLVVLALGMTMHVPAPKEGSGWSFSFDGPGLAILIYGVIAVVTLTNVLNHLPGIFALQRPLGVVQSGYEYLWGPAILAVVIGFAYTGVIEGRESDSRFWTVIYGAASESLLSVAALGVFAVLMWSLKLRASMIEANSRLEQARIFS